MKINKLDTDDKEDKENNELDGGNNNDGNEHNYNNKKVDNGNTEIRSDSLVSKPENRVTSDERWKNYWINDTNKI